MRGERGLPRAAVGAALVAALVSAPAALAFTHDEYVAQVNPICKDAAEKAKRIPDRIKSTGDPTADSFLATEAYGKLLGRTARRIAAVEPPPEDAAQVKIWIDGLHRQTRLIKRFIRSIARGQRKKAKVLIKRIGKAERINRSNAADLGLTACTTGGQPG
jgi:hypothetical protein